MSMPRLGHVIESAIAASGAPGTSWAVPTLSFPANQSQVVIVVDGLGWIPLQERAGHAPTLRSHFADTQTGKTCLPSTTAAALTYLATGQLPGATRMVGYSVAQSDKVFNLLSFADGIDPAQWQACPTYFERLADSGLRPVAISTPAFSGSGLTRASFRGAQFVGINSLRGRFDAARKLTQEQPSLVYLYWSEIDHAGHLRGVNSEDWIDALEHFDAELSAFLRNPPKNTTVTLTADHGMIDVTERIDIADVPDLAVGVRVLAGEGRAVHVHAQPGEGAAVRDRWKQYLGEGTRVLAPSQYEQVFGAGSGLDLMGDAVVLLGGATVVGDSRTQPPGMLAMPGVHGSFSDAETLIPIMLLAQ